MELDILYDELTACPVAGKSSIKVKEVVLRSSYSQKREQMFVFRFKF